MTIKKGFDLLVSKPTLILAGLHVFDTGKVQQASMPEQLHHLNNSEWGLGGTGTLRE